jgi:hypothetical protein
VLSSPFYRARAKGDKRSRWDSGDWRRVGFSHFEMEAALGGEEVKGRVPVFG